MSNKINLPKNKLDSSFLKCLIFSFSIHSTLGAILKLNHNEKQVIQEINNIQQTVRGLGIVGIEIHNKDVKSKEEEEEEEDNSEKSQKDETPLKQQQEEEVEVEVEVEKDNEQKRPTLTEEENEILESKNKVREIFEPHRKRLIEKYSEYFDSEFIPKDIFREFMQEYLLYMDASIKTSKNQSSITEQILEDSQQKLNNLMSLIDYNSENIRNLRSELNEKQTYQEISNVFSSTIYKLTESNPLEFESGINCDGKNIIGLMILNEISENSTNQTNPLIFGSEGVILNGVSHIRPYVRSQENDQTYVIDDYLSIEQNQKVSGIQGGEILEFMLSLNKNNNSGIKPANLITTNSLRSISANREIGENIERDLSHLNQPTQINSNGSGEYRNQNQSNTNESEEHTNQNPAPERPRLQNTEKQSLTEEIYKLSLEELEEKVISGITNPSEIIGLHVFRYIKLKFAKLKSSKSIYRVAGLLYDQDFYNITEPIRERTKTKLLKFITKSNFTSNDNLEDTFKEFLDMINQEEMEQFKEFYDNEKQSIQYSKTNKEQLQAILETNYALNTLFRFERRIEKYTFNKQGRFTIKTNNESQNIDLLNNFFKGKQRTHLGQVKIQPKTLDGFNIENSQSVVIDISKLPKLNEHQDSTTPIHDTAKITTDNISDKNLRTFLNNGYEITNDEPELVDEVSNTYSKVTISQENLKNINPSYNHVLKFNMWNYTLNSIPKEHKTLEEKVAFIAKKFDFSKPDKLGHSFKMVKIVVTVEPNEFNFLVIQKLKDIYNGIELNFPSFYKEKYADNPYFQKLFTDPELEAKYVYRIDYSNLMP